MSTFVSRLSGLFVVAMVVAGFSASSAFAANLVDGSISASGDTCSWTNGSTSADPPSTLTIDAASVNAGLSCTGSVSAVLNNSPVVSFDDGAGTGTADAVDATVTEFGQNCRYRAANPVLARDGSTRNYSGTVTGVPKVSGSFVCPSSVDLTAAVSFH
jgi:hypothetical protein